MFEIRLVAGESALLDLATGVLGLIIGSFLNVVILRLPRMLERAWWQEARSVLQLPARPPPERFSLAYPPSTCPRCGVRIKPWHNLPVVSWLLLRGRCANCAAPISGQYPLVELASGLAAAACAWRFGWSPQFAAALVLTWTLIALSVIDLHTQLLPDLMTLPLLWLGLLLSFAGMFTNLNSAVIGAMVGYVSLWSIYWIFKLITGKEGMGYGDFKLLAALGAWLGWQALPAVILLSSAVGALVGIGLILARRMDRGVPMPFGPYLACAGWITLMWGDQLTGFYLSAVHLH